MSELKIYGVKNVLPLHASGFSICNSLVSTDIWSLLGDLSV